MKYAFPAIFQEGDDGFSVFFPDESSSTTGGKTLKEAIEMAIDSLSLSLLYMEEQGEIIPAPSKIEDIELKDNQTIRMIYVDTEEYAKQVAEMQAREQAEKEKNLIKYYREKAGLNIKQLSDLLGAPYATVQDWNNGRRKPPIWLQNLIAEKIETSC